MLTVLIAVKAVLDSNVVVRIKQDGSDFDNINSKLSLNPFDEVAIEEALKLKEQGIVSKIIAVSIGQNKNIDILRLALARGATDAILIDATNYNISNIENNPLSIAKILTALVGLENPDLIFLGKKAIDNECGFVGQMLAAMLDYPQSVAASQIEMQIDNSDKNANNNLNNHLSDNKITHIVSTNEVDNGTIKMQLTLPAVITVDLNLNKPRFVKLPQLMWAKKQIIKTIIIDDLNINLQQNQIITHIIDSNTQKQCQFFDTKEQLLSFIKQQTLNFPI